MFFNHNSIPKPTTADQKAAWNRIPLRFSRTHERIKNLPKPALTQWMETVTNKCDLLINPIVAGIINVNREKEVSAFSMITNRIAPTDRTSVAMQYSDSLEHKVPIAFIREDLTQHVLSVMHENQAKELGFMYENHDLRTPFPFTNPNPGTPPAPPNGPPAGTAPTAAPGTETAPTVTPGTVTATPNANPAAGNGPIQNPAGFLFANLSPEFMDPNSTSKPVLVLVPAAIPYEFGDTPPAGNLSSEEVQTALQEISPTALAIGNAWLYLFEHHNGKSLHRQHGFDWIHVSEDFNKLCHNKLKERIGTKGEMILPNNADYEIVTKNVDLAVKNCIQEHLKLHPEDTTHIFPVNPSHGSANGNSNANMMDLGRESPINIQLASIMERCLSTVDANNTKKKGNANLFIEFFYILMTAYTVKNNDTGAYELRVDHTLNPNFTAIWEEKRATQHALNFNAQRKNHGRVLHDTGLYWYKLVDPPLANRAFLVQVRHAAWDNEKFSSSTNKSYLCFWNQVPMDKNSSTYQNTYDNINTTHMEEELDIADAQKSLSETKVYTNFNIRSWLELQQTIANLNQLILFMVADKEGKSIDTQKPYICRRLELILREMDHMDVKDWAKEALPQYPHIIFTIALKLQNLLAIWCNLASDTILNQRAAEGIPPAWSCRQRQAFDLNFENLHRAFTVVKSDNTIDGFGTAPPLCYAKLCPAPSSNEKKRYADDANLKQDNGHARNPHKKQNQDDLRSQKGMWQLAKGHTSVNTRDNKPPKVKFQGEIRCLCIFFCTRMKQCTLKNCKFHHIPSVQQLSDTDQAELVTWVASTPALEWTPGMAPPTRSNGNTTTQNNASNGENPITPTSEPKTKKPNGSKKPEKAEESKLDR
jgi:hypothetical protein